MVKGLSILRNQLIQHQKYMLTKPSVIFSNNLEVVIYNPKIACTNKNNDDFIENTLTNLDSV